jgi:hypothetical protein
MFVLSFVSSVIKYKIACNVISFISIIIVTVQELQFISNVCIVFRKV